MLNGCGKKRQKQKNQRLACHGALKPNRELAVCMYVYVPYEVYLSEPRQLERPAPKQKFFIFTASSFQGLWPVVPGQVGGITRLGIDTPSVAAKQAEQSFWVLCDAARPVSPEGNHKGIHPSEAATCRNSGCGGRGPGCLAFVSQQSPTPRK